MSPKLIACVGLAALATACASQPQPYASGMQTVTLDPSQPGPVQGVGIESQDIVVMADRMMRDMLADPAIAGQPAPPRIILDAEYFRNESAQRINTNIIVDNLRVNLQRAAGGTRAVGGAAAPRARRPTPRGG